MSLNETKCPRFGDVFFVNFECNGSVQGGGRPAVVFQNNLGNMHSPNVTVLPMTTKIKKVKQPTHVIIKATKSGLRQDSMVLCENPVCIPKEMLGKFITTLSDRQMSKIAEANMMASCAIACIDPDVLQNIWERASMLNAASYTCQPITAKEDSPCITKNGKEGF